MSGTGFGSFILNKKLSTKACKSVTNFMEINPDGVTNVFNSSLDITDSFKELEIWPDLKASYLSCHTAALLSVNRDFC